MNFHNQDNYFIVFKIIKGYSLYIRSMLINFLKWFLDAITVQQKYQPVFISQYNINLFPNID